MAAVTRTDVSEEAIWRLEEPRRLKPRLDRYFVNSTMIPVDPFKPEALTVNSKNIPEKLCQTAKYCVWRYEFDSRRDAWTKIPYNPRTGRVAKSNDESTFVDFQTALNTHEGKHVDTDGIGIGLFGQCAAIDIDHCVKDGKLSDMAQDIVDTMNCYTEFSPSGTGIRILFSVSNDYHYDREKYYINNQKAGLEIYLANMTHKFVTVTGHRMGSTPTEVGEKSKELCKVLKKYMRRPGGGNDSRPGGERPGGERPGSERPGGEIDIIDKALSSNDRRFGELWRGDISGYSSHSEADLALCGKLAFWTGKDVAAIDALFRRSGLYREKWNRRDYRENTIRKAITACRDVYDRESKQSGQRSENNRAPSEQTTTEQTAFTEYNESTYVESDRFVSDIKYFEKHKDRKTGFKNLDEYLTLYPGLAALGGAASLGKTSFCVQLADNLAEQGETVLYFSLEQTPVELVTKSLARKMFLEYPEKSKYFKNFSIKNGNTCEELENVKKNHAEKSKNKIIIRCDFTTTADDIRGYVEEFIRSTGRTPVVFIDYLQLISPPEDFRGDQRAAIDHTIKTLKIMQLQNELLVIMVSNFNRAAYNNLLSYSDFKESGMIEYTCDYVWGLQLYVTSERNTEYYWKPKNDRTKLVQTNEIEKRQMVSEAMTENPKAIEFVSLKNRNGRQSFHGDFDYYPEHDFFKTLEKSRDTTYEWGAKIKFY